MEHKWETYPSREAWLEGRRKGIGASDVPIILGLSSWSDPLTLYTQKIGLMPETEQSEPMEWGLRLEPVIADAYAEKTGRTVIAPPPFSLLRSQEHPWLFASIDRLEVEKGREGVLEIKTSGSMSEWSGEAPLPYQVQLQIQLLVTGLEWGTIAALFGGFKLRASDYARHDKLARRIMPKLAEFYARVSEQRPPEPTEKSSDALRWLYPHADEGTVNLPPESIEVLGRLDELKAARTANETEIENLENHLKGWLGERDRGVAPNGRIVTWKVVKMPERVLKASEFRRLHVGKNGGER